MGKHKNTTQEAILLQFMEKHSNIARGFVKGDKVKVDALWKDLVAELNKNGPPEKDVSGWKKVWMDWKAFIRKKVSHNTSEARATGGGPFNKHVLTPTEDAIAQLCGIYTAVEGVPSTHSFGVPSEGNLESSSDTPNEEEPQASTSTTATARRSRRQALAVTDCMANISEQTNAIKSLADGLNGNLDITNKIHETLSSLCDAVKELTFSFKEGNVENMRHHYQMERLRQEDNELKQKELQLEELKLDQRCSKKLPYDFH